MGILDLLKDASEVTGHVADVAVSYEQLKNSTEAMAGEAIITAEFIERGREMKRRLDERAENADPPGVLGFLYEVSEFLDK